jgi:hypothetical protein
MTDERTDDEIIDDVDADEVVAELDHEESTLLPFAPEIGPLYCEAAETDGAAGARRVLAAARGALSWSERIKVRRWAEGRFRDTGWVA